MKVCVVLIHSDEPDSPKVIVSNVAEARGFTCEMLGQLYPFILDQYDPDNNIDEVDIWNRDIGKVEFLERRVMGVAVAKGEEV